MEEKPIRKLSPGVLVLVAGVAAVSVGVMLGPRVSTDIPVAGSTGGDLPGIDMIGEYLDQEESRIGGVRPGARRMIVWDGQRGERTPLSLVYLHGFTATRMETSPLTETVAQRLGANAYLHRFPGHGLDSSRLAMVTLKDWVGSAIEAAAIGGIIGEQTVIIACSNGATLATIAATHPSCPPVHALVLLSPNFQPRDQRTKILTMPWGLQLGDVIAGPMQHWEFDTEEQSRHWSSPFPTRAVGTLMAAVEVCASLDFSKITMPAMMIYNPEDSVVDHGRSLEIFRSFASPSRVEMVVDSDTDPSHHVIAGDLRSPGTTDEIAGGIIRFIESLGMP